jgi:hypothetical protein
MFYLIMPFGHADIRYHGPGFEVHDYRELIDHDRTPVIAHMFDYAVRTNDWIDYDRLIRQMIEYYAPTNESVVLIPYYSMVTGTTHHIIALHYLSSGHMLRHSSIQGDLFPPIIPKRDSTAESLLTARCSSLLAYAAVHETVAELRRVNPITPPW